MKRTLEAKFSNIQNIFLSFQDVGYGFFFLLVPFVPFVEEFLIDLIQFVS